MCVWRVRPRYSTLHPVARLLSDTVRAQRASHHFASRASINVPNFALGAERSDAFVVARKKRELGRRRYSGTESGPWSSVAPLHSAHSARPLRRARSCSSPRAVVSYAPDTRRRPDVRLAEECVHTRLRYCIFNRDSKNLTENFARYQRRCWTRLYITFLLHFRNVIHMLLHMLLHM